MEALNLANPEIGFKTVATGVKSVSMDEYHNGVGISKSGIDLILKSPRHYWDAYINPFRKEREESKAFKMGTAVHTALLEPTEFMKRYIISQKFDRRTKIGKAAAAEFESNAKGKITLDTEEMLTICECVRSALSHNKAGQLIRQGEAELSAYWVDEYTGLLCKCRPDYIRNNGRVIIDVKTTQDASPNGFAKSIANYNYHISAAFTTDGWEAASGNTVKAYIYLAVETKPPYSVACYIADEEQLQYGRTLYREALEIYNQCLREDVWPGYSDEINVIQLPKWAYK